MTTVKEDGGRLNMYAIEPTMEIIEVTEEPVSYTHLTLPTILRV